MAPTGVAAGFWLAHLRLGTSIQLAEWSGLGIIGTALFGSRVFSDRAFRLLHWIRPEPPGLAGLAREAPTWPDGRPRRPATPLRASYLARPGRRALVIDDLAGLRGPVTGVVELPLRLFWSLPGYRFDLEAAETRLWYYQTVLREASRAADLTAYLDAATLVRLWPELYLPRGVRQAWEDRHASLRTAVSA